MGVYGQLQRHNWLPESGLDADPYSLFFMYGRLLGWAGLNDGNEEDPCALWGFADAGGDWSNSPHPGLQNLLWAQLELTERGIMHGVPIDQIADCADRTIRRAGKYYLNGMQLIAPCATLRDPRWPTPIVHVVETANPADRCEAIIEVEAGQGSILSNYSSRIIQEFSRAIQSDALHVTASAVIPATNGSMIVEPSAMSRATWLGASTDRMVLNVKMPEFSLEVCCNLLAHVFRACSISELEGAIIISIARSAMVDNRVQ